MSDEEQRSAGTVLAPWAGYAANGRMIRTLGQIWAQSGEAVSAFVENIFESEYLGHGLKAFEGLPAWAVPLPEDFDEEKHVGMYISCETVLVSSYLYFLQDLATVNSFS